MADNKLSRTVVSENRQEWFWMLISYMKMKTLALWLHYYPDTSLQSFEVIWPILLDRMLSQATAAAVKALDEKLPTNPN